MSTKREAKDRKRGKNKVINTIIIRKNREAKEMWIKGKCEEIGNYDNVYDMRNYHKKVNQEYNRNINDPAYIQTNKEILP